MLFQLSNVTQGEMLGRLILITILKSNHTVLYKFRKMSDFLLLSFHSKHLVFSLQSRKGFYSFG